MPVTAGRRKQPPLDPARPLGQSKYILQESNVPVVDLTPESDEVGDLRFEDLFAVLPPKQQVWLALRSTLETDKEACDETSLDPGQATRWKTQPAFKFCYGRITRASATRERDLVAAIERANAVRAAVEKQRLIMKPWGDITNPQERSAKTLLINDTIERILPKRRTIERKATRSMRQLVTNGHLEAEPMPGLRTPDPLMGTQDSGLDVPDPNDNDEEDSV